MLRPLAALHLLLFSLKIRIRKLKIIIPSPMTLILASVLMIPNKFSASQMYNPSSLSQTPVKNREK